MKKYLAGFLAGVLFTIAGAAFADDIQSLIGKKIQGEAVVELNGQALDTAIIVDGKSYAPVRAIGEAAGYDVSMQNKKIILGEKATATTPGKGPSVEEQKAKLEKRIADVKQRISDSEKLIEASNSIINDPNKNNAGEEEFLKMRQRNLSEQQALLAELEAQLAALN
ncbi:hypothetical protein GCM10008014_08220 [Paenibacillus silvae]|uniref:Copper amine oxidase-like N-terminal domain-containing protein n=1 Tax=Paenibacillus silvae TaxID=1325358 RepID=A0ABQ1Z0P4_9BACL|nr:hypothetical protein [Paenibacillus silvae]GGH45896.1 hypothetical protein GCM10008014_08220 [Paenibacillus silvae]